MFIAPTLSTNVVVVCCIVLQCVALCCSVLQCVAVCLDLHRNSLERIRTRHSVKGLFVMYIILF